MSVKKRRQNGFTLIELLVVISIISLLASIVLTSVNKARISARDVKRLADVHQLQVALDLYFDKFNTYPSPDANTPDSNGWACGGWDDSAYNPFISGLVTGGILAKTPVDPLNTGLSSGGYNCGGYAYRYYFYGAGTGGCDLLRGNFYVLVINYFEGAAPAPSPGFSCSVINW
jgi:prepilin-type N-terminal cleavage/methylation domain-containing protein